MAYGATLKPGDEAILRLDLSGGHSDWAKAHNGKVVKVERRVADKGWYVEGHGLWFSDNKFEPIGKTVAMSATAAVATSVVDAPTGTRVRCKGTDKSHITGVVVHKDDIDKYPGPNKPTNWLSARVVRVDDGKWDEYWRENHKPFFRWATDSYWMLDKDGAASAPIKVGDSGFCNCSSPDLITNTACGKKFQYCRSCKKERL